MAQPRRRDAPAQVVYRSCPLCEAHCGVAVELEADGQGVRGVRGDDEDPHSRGYICPKAYGLKGLQEDPDRLRRPLRRVGGARGADARFEEISWEEAFELAASRLREIREAHGPNSIATYFGNPTAHDFGAGFFVPTFQRALGTRWRFSASSVDQLPKMLSCSAMFGGALHVPVPDVDRTDFLLVLGANPLASNGSLMTAPDMPGRLRLLRERGGRLVVVDPRRSETAAIADEHLALRPGSDAFLLFAMIHVLFAENLCRSERLAELSQGEDVLRGLAADFAPEAVAAVTGVSAERIRSLTRAFAGARRAACYGRIGTCTQEFGSLASWLVDVLNVLTGNLDRVGGAMFPRAAHEPAGKRPGRRGHFPYARWRSRVRDLPEFAGELPVAALSEEMEGGDDERLRALFTMAGNPVLSTPNGGRLARALGDLDFMVSVDIYRNETTCYADLILPTTTPLERSNYDLVFHQLAVRNGAKWSPAVLPAPPDAKHGWEILLEIGARLNGTQAEALEEMTFEHLLGSAVGSPETACPDVAPEQARKQLAHLSGPERILDLLLRAGPYGDRFDDANEGLNLAKLIATPHGVDLGALEPRLPEHLATESGRIELAPEPLVADVERLRQALADGRDADFVLVGRRHIRSNNSWMHNVHALAKGRDRCTLQLNPADAERLGLRAGDKVRVRSRVGEVEAPLEITDVVMPGVVSLPHGFGHDAPGAKLSVASRQPGVNSNLLTDESQIDALSGNAVLNGIPVELSAA